MLLTLYRFCTLPYPSIFSYDRSELALNTLLLLPLRGRDLFLLFELEMGSVTTGPMEYGRNNATLFLGQPRGTRIFGRLALECLSHHVRRLYALKPTCCVEAHEERTQGHWSTPQLRSQLTVSTNLPACE